MVLTANEAQGLPFYDTHPVCRHVMGVRRKACTYKGNMKAQQTKRPTCMPQMGCKPTTTTFVTDSTSTAVGTLAIYSEYFKKSVSLTKHYSGDQIKKNEIGGARCTYDGEERCIQGFSG